MRILLIDDDEDMGILVQNSLDPYSVEQSLTAHEAFRRVKESYYDLFIIDIDLPDASGFDICQTLSSDINLPNTPIIILSTHTQKAEIIYGLNSGADDYLTKPFDAAELKARVDARLRKRRHFNGNLFQNSLYKFDTEFQTCQCLASDDKRDLDLTPTEFRILLTLVQNEGSVLTREDLIRLLWKHCGINIQSRGIDSHVAHIRKKMGHYRNTIMALYGRGYTYKKDHP